MSRIMTGLFLALTCGQGMSAQAEVKFIDYDYTRFSQDVTECDRLA
jgi:glutaredoxin-related protein